MNHFWKASAVTMVIITAVFSHPMAPRVTCSLCPPGSHVQRACSARSNTACRPCIKGTFSEIPTNSKTCTVCSACPQGAYVNKPCTAYSDTVCSLCFQPPPERSDLYEMSCDNSDPEVMGTDLFDLMISDDPSDTKPPSGELKGGNVGAKDLMKNYNANYFFRKTNKNNVKQKETGSIDIDANNKNVLNAKKMNNGKYNENYFYIENNIDAITEEYNREKLMEDIRDEKRSHIDSNYDDEEKFNEDGFVSPEAKLDEAVDKEINYRVQRDVENVHETGVGAEDTDNINKDETGKNETDVDIKGDNRPLKAENDNNNKEDKHENGEKKDEVDEEGSLGNGVADNVMIDGKKYSTAPDAVSNNFDVDKENGGKDLNMLPMGPTVQETLPQLSSEANVGEDGDEPRGRLGFVKEEPFPTQTFEDSSRSKDDPGKDENSANGDNAHNESNDYPTNSNADIETAHPGGSPIGQNEDGTQPTIAQFVDVGLHKDVVNEEVITTETISEIQDIQENDSTKSTTTPTANVGPSFNEGRLEAVKTSFDDNENDFGENSTSQLPGDSLAVKLSEHDVGNDQDGHETDTEVSTMSPTKSSNEEVTLSDEPSGKQSRKLSELENERSNNGNSALDDVKKDGVPKVGQAHAENNEDSQGKRRAIIILCASVGGVAFFTLIFIATRCWKKRRTRHFKEMTKVSKTEEESVQLQPINQPQRDNHDETSARSTNGFYRRLPDAGQTSSGMPQNDQEMEKTSAPETASTIAPLLSFSPANENLLEPEASPPREPLVSSQEKLKYIDDSTDDEYVNLHSPRLISYRLSKVTEETPPTSPSLKQ